MYEEKIVVLLLFLLDNRQEGDSSVIIKID